MYYPQADVIPLVVDNLNIHTPSILYEFLSLRQARCIIQQLGFNYTPKHTSWLNQVEIELSVLPR
ncbi:transposase [Trichormus azollae]|uniref:transposase n=1 Tax=Trichormus azollae TaxID=1164 RepID=UPI0009DAE86F